METSALWALFRIRLTKITSLRMETAALPVRARPRAQKRDSGSGSRQFVRSATIGRFFLPVAICSGRHARTFQRPGRARSLECVDTSPLWNEETCLLIPAPAIASNPP
jgi:hypothetical protein